MTSAEFTAYDVITIAIDLEKNGEALYNELSVVCKERTAADVFLSLASHKKAQIAQYEKLLMKVRKEAPAEAYPGDYALYLKSLADEHSVSVKELVQKALATHTTMEAVELALDHKKSTLLYLQELALHVDASDKAIVSDLIKKKQADLQKLLEMKKVS